MNRFTKILEKVGLSAFSKNINIVKDSLKHDINKKADMMPLTTQQYNDLVVNGSIVIDGKTITYDTDTYYVITDDCEDLNKITGDIEYGTFNLLNSMTPAVDDIIPIDNRLNGNIEYDNGYKLKKGKTYLINVNIGVYTGATTDNAHLRYELRFNSNTLVVNGASIPATSTSPWASTPLSCTFTPTDDGVLTINCISIENISGVVDSVSNISIIEIPNPTSITNITDEHIKSLVPEGMKNTEALKLKTLSNGNFASVGSWVASDGNTYMSLDIINTSGSLTRLQFTDSEGTIAVHKYDGTNWSFEGRYIKTKVSDIPLTKITSNLTGLTLEDRSGYYVENGICHVTLWSISSTTSITNHILLNNIPKPKNIDKVKSIVDINGNGVGLAWVDYRYNNLYINLTLNTTGFCSFSYLVAES